MRVEIVNLSIGRVLHTNLKYTSSTRVYDRDEEFLCLTFCITRTMKYSLEGALSGEAFEEGVL